MPQEQSPPLQTCESSTAHWLVVLVGLTVMFGPSLFDLSVGVWSTNEQGHGPIVLAISVWLIYRKWPVVNGGIKGDSPSAFGWLTLIVALMAYILGRSQQILMFEVGALIVVLASLLLLFKGPRTLLAMLFPLLFMAFMIPLPGSLVDTLTLPMKMAVTCISEQVLFWLGYPIARAGVILHIGQYQLLVADACAGLHTLFTLEALGLLYLNLVRHESMLRNVLLALLIVPISFSANVIRVMTLTLVTFHFGDEAGQGFIHGFAGMVLFVTALVLIICVDGVLRFCLRGWHQYWIGSVRKSA